MPPNVLKGIKTGCPPSPGHGFYHLPDHIRTRDARHARHNTICACLPGSQPGTCCPSPVLWLGLPPSTQIASLDTVPCLFPSLPLVEQINELSLSLPRPNFPAQPLCSLRSVQRCLGTI